MPECSGCKNIKHPAFPFVYAAVINAYYIDNEGCGVDSEDMLRIFYCPVCGINLKEGNLKKIDCSCNPMYPGCHHYVFPCKTDGQCFKPKPCMSPNCIHL